MFGAGFLRLGADVGKWIAEYFRRVFRFGHNCYSPNATRQSRSISKSSRPPSKQKPSKFAKPRQNSKLSLALIALTGANCFFREQGRRAERLGLSRASKR